MPATFSSGGGTTDLPYVHVNDGDSTYGAAAGGIGVTGDDGPVPGAAHIGGPADTSIVFVNEPPTPAP